MATCDKCGGDVRTFSAIHPDACACGGNAEKYTGRTFELICAAATFTDEELDYAIDCCNDALDALEPLGSRFSIVRDDLIRTRGPLCSIMWSRGADADRKRRLAAPPSEADIHRESDDRPEPEDVPSRMYGK